MPLALPLANEQGAAIFPHPSDYLEVRSESSQDEICNYLLVDYMFHNPYTHIYTY